MWFLKKDQKDTIHYNSSTTISNIPLEAYEYVVNGKSAIEWIMERYQIIVGKINWRAYHLENESIRRRICDGDGGVVWN
jgi:predicted helicase